MLRREGAASVPCLFLVQFIMLSSPCAGIF
jgi:hypothetical protein